MRDPKLAHILVYTLIPQLEGTFKSDNDEVDLPTVYDQENENGPTDDPGPAPPCEDDKVNKKFIKSALYFTYL